MAWRIKDRKLVKNRITRFLNRHPSLATKLSSRLDHQRALASDPVALKDNFTKVRFPYSIMIELVLIIYIVSKSN